MSSTNILKNQFKSGKSVILAEIAPQKETGISQLKAAAASLKGKVHAVGISDNRDGAAVSAIAAAAILSNEGIETVLHMTTRDRNRIALESDFLGALALGLPNILCTTGTHQTLGPHKAAKNVFDVDSVQLLKLCAEHKAAPESLCLGAAASPFADPMNLQLMKLDKKIRSGASFVITEPVFDTRRFEIWWNAVKKAGLHQKAAIIAGIRPIISREEAAALATKRPNAYLPAEMQTRIQGKSSDAEAREEGIGIAVSIIEKLKTFSGLRGFEIRADHDAAAALEVIDKAGLRIA